MKKKIMVFGSLLAVFLMLMIPNIGAVEYQKVKEIYQERNDTVIILMNFLNEKIDNLNFLSTTFIIILHAILQGFFMIGMYLLATTIGDYFDNFIIGFIVSLINGAISGLILSKWILFIENKFQLTNIQSMLLGFVPWIIYYIFAIFIILRPLNNISQKHIENNILSNTPIITQC